VYSPQAYRAAFGAEISPAAEELVLARIASTAVDDPLDDLIGAAPIHIRAWMQRKARLADGCRIGLPVCGRQALNASLAEDESESGPWMVEDGQCTRRGLDLAWTGLIRDLCGFSWQAIANLDESSLTHVRGMAAHHRRLLGTDKRYARRVARVAKVAIDLCARST